MSNKQNKTAHNMSLNNLLALFVLSGLILAMAVGYLAIRPIFIKAENTKAEIRKVENDILALEQLGEDTEMLRQNYEQVRDERDRIIGLLPSENKEEDLLALLNQLASRSGVLFSHFAPEGGNETDDFEDEFEDTAAYESYTTRVNVTGDHESIIKFLKEVENSSRFMEFDSVGASGSGNLGVSNPQIDVDLKLIAYYRSESTNEELEEEGGQNEQVE